MKIRLFLTLPALVLMISACQTTSTRTGELIKQEPPSDERFTHTWSSLTANTQVNYGSGSIDKSILIQGHLSWPLELKVIGVSSNSHVRQALDMDRLPMVNEAIMDMRNQTPVSQGVPRVNFSQEMPIRWPDKSQVTVNLKEMEGLPDGIGLLTGTNTILAATGFVSVTRDFEDLTSGLVDLHENLKAHVQVIRRNEQSAPHGQEPIQQPVAVEMQISFYLHNPRAEYRNPYNYSAEQFPFVTNVIFLDDKQNQLLVRDFNRRSSSYNRDASFLYSGSWTLMPGRELDAVQFELITSAEEIIVPFEIRNLRLP